MLRKYGTCVIQSNMHTFPTLKIINHFSLLTYLLAIGFHLVLECMSDRWWSNLTSLLWKQTSVIFVASFFQPVWGGSSAFQMSGLKENNVDKKSQVEGTILLYAMENYFCRNQQLTKECIWNIYSFSALFEFLEITVYTLSKKYNDKCTNHLFAYIFLCTQK